VPAYLVAASLVLRALRFASGLSLRLFTAVFLRGFFSLVLFRCSSLSSPSGAFPAHLGWVPCGSATCGRSSFSLAPVGFSSVVCPLVWPVSWRVSRCSPSFPEGLHVGTEGLEPSTYGYPFNAP